MAVLQPRALPLSGTGLPRSRVSRAALPKLRDPEQREPSGQTRRLQVLGSVQSAREHPLVPHRRPHGLRLLPPTPSKHKSAETKRGQVPEPRPFSYPDGDRGLGLSSDGGGRAGCCSQLLPDAGTRVQAPARAPRAGERHTSTSLPQASRGYLAGAWPSRSLTVLQRNFRI